ncbi:hypothetical protein ACLOJK_022517, partial [Asimina triloba]
VFTFQYSSTALLGAHPHVVAHFVCPVPERRCPFPLPGARLHDPTRHPPLTLSAARRRCAFLIAATSSSLTCCCRRQSAAPLLPHHRSATPFVRVHHFIAFSYPYDP